MSALSFRSRHALLLGLLALLVAAAGCRATQPAPEDSPAPQARVEQTEQQEAAQCFPVETLTSEADRALARRLLAQGLDHEALYTVVAGIKPISSVAGFQVPAATSDSMPASGDGFQAAQADSLRARARGYARVASALHCGDVHALLIPFRQVRGGKRLVQMYFVDRSRLSREIAEHPDFWMQWGFAPQSTPGAVLTTVENDSSYARFRGYGYLFGYPDHAVDFFTQAARQSDHTGEFVERDFFQIPTHARTEGHFVYAVPEGYEPTTVDSSLHRRAANVLNEYRRRRPAYLRPDSTLRSVQLIRDWRRKKESMLQK